MRSPFQIFRKHQNILIVVLTGLAMIAFVLLGSIRNLSSLPPYVMVVLGAVLVGGAFWIFGLQGGKGKQSEYGLTGAVVGVAAGLAIMFFSRPKPVVETSVGKISTSELRDLVEQRNLAVRFMRNAFDSSVTQPERPMISRRDLANLIQRSPQMRSQPFILNLLRQHQAVDQWQRQRYDSSFPLQPLELSTGDRAATERDGVLLFLLLKEAKELGVRVSNEAVDAYINRVTNDQMTQQIFNNIRHDLGLKKSRLYDILREEIAAQIVLRLERPARMRIVTPGEYWEQYRKLNIREKLEFVPLEVKDFTAQVPKPTDTELRAFFDKYKQKAPTGLISPEPAFGLPERIQLAYFKADYEEVERDVLKKLDQDDLSAGEIAAALKAIDKAVADVQLRINDGTIKKELAAKELLGARQDQLRKLLTSGKKLRRFDFEIVKHYEDDKATRYQNPAWKAPHPGGEPGDPFQKRSPTKKTGAKPAAKPGDGDKAPGPKFPETKPKKSSGKEQSGAMHAPRSPEVFGVAPFSFTALLTQTPKSAAKPTSGASKKPVEAKRPAKPLFPPLPGPPPLPEGPPPPPFQQLDEDLRNTIRDELLKQKVQTEIVARMRKAAAAMESFRTKYLAWLENPEQTFDRVAVSDALKAKAGELGLKYVVTELFGELEFDRDSARFPMHGARDVPDLSDTGLNRQQPRFLQEVLFPRGGETDRQRATSLYTVIRAKDFQDAFGATEHVYVLWKTAYQAPKTPDFDDKGIRENVLKAWRQAQARPLAEKRADELAKLVRERKKPMRDVLAGRTVTDKPGGPPLLPERTSESFTWLTRQPQFADSSAPPLGIHQQMFQIAPSRIQGVTKAGDTFRRYIFDTLKDGEVGVAPNADKSVYYVVRVLDRQGTSPEGRAYHIQQLIDSQPTAEQSTLYGPLKRVRNPVNKALIDETTDRLYKKYNVRFNRRLDKEGE
jgi:hypothetical protein